VAGLGLWETQTGVPKRGSRPQGLPLRFSAAQLGRRCPVALAGRGGSAELARRAGVRLLQDAPVAAAASVAEGG